MTTLTPQLRQAYHDAVQVLFAGAVQSSPSDINQLVVDDIDTMIVEIAKCSKSITEFGFSIIYEIAISPVVGTVVSKIMDGLAASVTEELINNKLQEYLLDWVNTLLGNKLNIACINVARANWRSKVTIDLMDI